MFPDLGFLLSAGRRGHAGRRVAAGRGLCDGVGVPCTVDGMRCVWLFSVSFPVDVLVHR